MFSCLRTEVLNGFGQHLRSFGPIPLVLSLELLLVYYIFLLAVGVRKTILRASQLLYSIGFECLWLFSSL